MWNNDFYKCIHRFESIVVVGRWKETPHSSKKRSDGVSFWFLSFMLESYRKHRTIKMGGLDDLEEVVIYITYTFYHLIMPSHKSGESIVCGEICCRGISVKPSPGSVHRFHRWMDRWSPRCIPDGTKVSTGSHSVGPRCVTRSAPGHLASYRYWYGAPACSAAPLKPLCGPVDRPMRISNQCVDRSPT
jgi:hypothetical protein